MLAKHKFYILLVIMFSKTIFAASTGVPSFQITEVFVSNGNNMHFRVFGMNSSVCPGNSSWAYIDESDSGAKAKISTLLSAYATKKKVTLYVEPVNYYNNGVLYCHIIELGVKD